ncbi:cAMP-dependent protein kinase inhibitor alpha [Grus japonensis]|uniref:cAMP-dependent protein kinase inhibitor alpha n=1 Tax=Grus japonensis TaxID=30415 RepID=A0ABC9X176_GRUJA
MLVLGPALFNTFVSDMDSGIECTLSKFASNAKLCSVVDTLEGRDAIQRDLDRLEKWGYANLTKFNKAKFKVLNVGWGNPKHKYWLCGEWIESNPEEKDLVDKVAQRSCGCPIPGSVQAQTGWGFEQPGLVEGVPAHGRGAGTR